MRYIIYTEIHENGKMERWYYGTYTDRDKANELAIALGSGDGVWHCVCAEKDAQALNIQNLPG